MVNDNEENKTSLEDEDDISSKVLKIVKKVFYVSLIILTCIIVFGAIYVYSQINSVKRFQIPSTNISLSITEKINLP